MAQKRTPYGKGRRPVSDAPGGGNYSEKWHEKLGYLEKPDARKPKEIRIVGGLFTIFQHFVRFQRKKDGSKGGFYEVCPDFDWETGEFRKGPDAVCPLCADFQAEDLPAELRLLGSFRYYFDAFDVTAAKEGRKDVFGVVFTNKYGKSDLAAIGDILGNDVDDLRNGCSVHWNFNAKAQDPKDRVRFYQGQKIPVSFDENRGLFIMKGGGMAFEGEPTPFDEIIEVKSAEEIRADLVRLGLYAKLESVMDVMASRDEPSRPRGQARRDAAPSGQRSEENPRAARRQEAPKDEAWGTPSNEESLESAPAEDAWGTDSGSSAGDDAWGTDSGSSAGDDAWGTDSGSSAGDNGASEESSADFDNSLFDGDGWGATPSSSDKPTSSAPADDDPETW